ncbi:hypothetical protein [Caulobacter sp. DWP3-1-3b2]|uniref:hypothetical protein n=1 Tax=Caulobacter sp. DWP3-1-3b2 TaxID=2804643 RepID=UPI003CF1593E
MKCADCKFWKAESEAYRGDEQFGDCRRYAPRATFDLPLIVSRIQVERGDLADLSEDRPEEISSICQRYTAWPATWGSDFCGDFVAKVEQRAGFV